MRRQRGCPRQICLDSHGPRRGVALVLRCFMHACIERRLRINISLLNQHPDFVNSGLTGYPNDCAVIGWEQDLPIMQTPKIDYATMAMTTDQVGSLCFITGWGRISGEAYIYIYIYI